MGTNIDLLSEEQIRYDGIFDMKELYKHAHDWLGWKGFEVAEKSYKEAVKPTGKDIKVKWEAEKDHDEYSKITIKIKFEISRLNDVVVQQAGKEVNMNKGVVEIFTTATLTLDKEDDWQTKPFFKFLQRFYERYLYSDEIKKLKGKVWQIGWDFHNEMKAFLSLYKY